MNEEWWRMKDEWWRMMISSCWGVLQTDGQKDKLTNKQTDKQTDICDCRVAFATEKSPWKDLTFDIQSKDSICKDLTYKDASEQSWLIKWKPMWCQTLNLAQAGSLTQMLGKLLEMLQSLTSLYLLQWGIWTKWDISMVMNMNRVTIISFWYSTIHQHVYLIKDW